MKKKLFKILLALSIFLISLKSPLKVQANETDLDAIFGSLINSSQGGRGGSSTTNVRDLGHAIGGDRGGGHRLGVTPGRGGESDKVRFNPSLIDIDTVYNNYINYVSEFSDNDAYIIPIHRTFSSYTGFIVDMQPGGDTNLEPQDFDNALYLHGPEYTYFYFVGAEGETMLHTSSSGRAGTDRWYNDKYYTIKSNAARWNPYGSTTRVLAPPDATFSIDYIVLSNELELSYGGINVVHNSNNLPTKREFINNYTDTFNVEYNTETNQFIESNNYYEYDLNDFSDDSVEINKEYVTNNYVVVEGDTIIEGDSKDYTNILERIITNIKALPQEIADKLEDILPDSVNEAGTNIWDFLTSIVDTLGELITALGNIGDTILSAILDGLESLVSGFLELIFPTEEQLSNLTDNFNNLTDKFTSKFTVITDIGNSISTVFSSPKSLHDLTFTIHDEEIHVLPRYLEQPISNVRAILSGAVFLATIIELYKRFVGREDMIK